MFTYAIVEISGRQYKISPTQDLLVDHLGDVQTLECDKVLLLAEGDKLSIGTPYLKETIVFDVNGAERGKKIRVAKFHAKANTRRVIGSRIKKSRIKMQVKESSKKAEK